jgi:hypothetical protein
MQGARLIATTVYRPKSKTVIVTREMPGETLHPKKRNKNISSDEASALQVSGTRPPTKRA